MPAPDRTDSTQHKRDAILAAALALFAERGYHGTAIPEVAQRAHVGTGTIYRYFASKELLVNAVFREAKTLLRDFLVPRVDISLAPREVFRQLWWGLYSFAREHPLPFKFLELQDHVPYLDQDSRNVELQVLAPIWAYSVMSRRTGVARDMPSEAIMALVWGAFVGLLKAEHTGHITLTDAVFSDPLKKQNVSANLLARAEKHLFCDSISSSSRKNRIPCQLRPTRRQNNSKKGARHANR
jgi:AcrR family transcriptional regulator